jgi:molybdate transport system permease protein
VNLPRAQGADKFAFGLIGLSGLFFVFLFLVPLLSLLVWAIPGWLAGDWQFATVSAALRLSLVTATVATILTMFLGTPLAYVLARHKFPGSGLLEVLIDLPLVLPPAVAGIALLVAFGRSSPIGRLLASFGVTLPFTTAAVIIAQIFVAAPFYIRAAKAGFAGVDPRLEQISATLGESRTGTFFRVTLPLAQNTLLGGVIMAWARALGEFGATILFAGNFMGRTQTMPLAIYAAMQSNINTALVLATILLLTSLVLLLLLRLVIR